MNKRLVLFACAGIAAIGAASWFRYRATNSFEHQLALMMRNPRARNLDSYVGALQRKVAESPNDKQARVNLAETYGKLRLMDLAAEQLDAVTKIDPDDEAAAVGLGNAQLAMLDVDKAEAQFRKVVARWPKSAFAWQGLATALYQRKHYLEAIESSREAVKLDPKDPNSRFVLASSLVAFGQQFPAPDSYRPFFLEARDELQKLLPIWPAPGEIHLRLGTCEAGLNNGKGAIEHYRKAADLLENRPDVMSELIKEYLGAGKYADARKVINAAIAKYPDYGPFHDMLGQVLQASTSPADQAAALSAFQQAARRSPNNPYILDHLGSALLRAGKMIEARDAFEDSLRSNAERPYPYQQLSVVYTRLKDRTRANEAAKMATRMVFNDQQLRQAEHLAAAYPTDINLNLVLADRYVDLGMLGPARDKYLLILKLDRGNKRATDGLAKIEKLEREAPAKLAKS